jgi:hypothetical protein
MKKNNNLWLALIPVLTLAACASDKADKPKEEEPKPAKEAPFKADNLICPQVAILQAAQDVRDYGRETPAPSELVASAHMKRIEGDCGYKTDKNHSGIDINFTLHMNASKGPRLGGVQTSFPYFIAIIDPSDAIVSRQTVTASFSFSGLDKKADLDEPLHVFIPLSEQAMQAGPDYRVLVGFQLPKDQVGK